MKTLTKEELLIENKQLKERVEFLEKLVLQLTQKQSYQYPPFYKNDWIPTGTPSFPSDYKVTCTSVNA